MSKRDCEHGSLARSCPVCEAQAARDEAQDELGALVECIEENLPLYAYDNGDEGDPSIYERVAYAGDELRGLQAEVERLRAALEQIAKIDGRCTLGCTDPDCDGCQLGEWARDTARAALAPTEAPKENDR